MDKSLPKVIGYELTDRGIIGYDPEEDLFGDGLDGHVVISSDTQLPVTEDSTIYEIDCESFTIDAGYTLTTDHRCKALIIRCRGNVIINGTLTMTARGAYADPGGDYVVQLLEGMQSLTDLPFGPVIRLHEIGGLGGLGGARIVHALGLAGYPGQAGLSGKSGGGGGGGAGQSFDDGSGYNTYAGNGGDGADGTPFGGGGGGGGGGSSNSHYYPGTDGSDATIHGGPGGNGGSSTTTSAGGGGAGNPGGVVGSPGYTGGGETGEDGTGGVIIIIAKGDVIIGSSGVISADGVDGGRGSGNSSYFGSGGGGASGGGIISIYCWGSLQNSGSIHAYGGKGGECGYYTDTSIYGSQGRGADGGAGSIDIVQYGVESNILDDSNLFSLGKGIVSGSTPYYAQGFAHGCDGDTSTYYRMAGVGTYQIDYGSALFTLVKYKLYGNASYLTYAPGTWTFEGSNDGATWDTLDTQTSQTWSAAGWKTYAFTNTTKYRYYRINVTATGGASACFIHELEAYQVV